MWVVFPGKKPATTVSTLSLIKHDASGLSVVLLALSLLVVQRSWGLQRVLATLFGLWPTGTNLYLSWSLLDPQRNVFLWTPVLVYHGDVLTVVIVRHFGLQCVRGAHLCVNGSPESRRQCSEFPSFPFPWTDRQTERKNCCLHKTFTPYNLWAYIPEKVF